MRVNSSHHQSIREPGRGLRITATAPDGVVEAVQWTGGPQWIVGVQWHPENDWDTDIVSRRIFEHFAAAVHAYAEDGRMGGVSAAAD